jgi:cytochrome c553
MQLRAFKDGGRGDTAAYNPMVKDTHNLTDAEIVAVASFYASLPPRAKK